MSPGAPAAYCSEAAHPQVFIIKWHPHTGPEPAVPWVQPRYCRLVTGGTHFWVTLWQRTRCCTLVRNDNRTGQELQQNWSVAVRKCWYIKRHLQDRAIVKSGSELSKCQSWAFLKKSVFPELDLETKTILTSFLIKGAVQQIAWNYQTTQS